MAKKSKVAQGPRSYFKNDKTGAQSPVLRKKKNEKDFNKRMTGLGWILEGIDSHETADGLALHAGQAESCPICARTKPDDAAAATEESEVSADKDPSSDEPVAEPVVTKKRRGRPKGSKNKKKDDE
jgi:hypothetical protein